MFTQTFRKMFVPKLFGCGCLDYVACLRSFTFEMLNEYKESRCQSSWEEYSQISYIKSI